MDGFCKRTAVIQGRLELQPVALVYRCFLDNHFPGKMYSGTSLNEQKQQSVRQHTFIKILLHVDHV